MHYSVAVYHELSVALLANALVASRADVLALHSQSAKRHAVSENLAVRICLHHVVDKVLDESNLAISSVVEGRGAERAELVWRGE